MKFIKNWLVKLFKPIIDELVRQNVQSIIDDLHIYVDHAKNDIKSTLTHDLNDFSEQISATEKLIQQKSNTIDSKLSDYDSKIKLIDTHVVDFTNRFSNTTEQIKETHNQAIDKINTELGLAIQKSSSKNTTDMLNEIDSLRESLKMTYRAVTDELNRVHFRIKGVEVITEAELKDIETKTTLEAVDLLNYIDERLDVKMESSTVDIFPTALKFTLAQEGGYTNDPADPGGATNYGIIQTEYNTYRKNKKLPEQSVKMITMVETKDIYKNNYWLSSKCENYSTKLAIVMFDTAVNFGTGKAAKWLQKALDVAQDGNIGPATLAKLAKTDQGLVANRICEYRIAFRYSRVAAAPSQKVFLSGWLNRDNALKKLIGGTITIIG